MVDTPIGEAQREVVVSVVIPAYNAEAFIGTALKHALAQTMNALEVIVVDDGSTDATVDVVLAQEDSRIRLLQQPNAGPSAARNRGIKAARGKYVAFLDADDWWESTKLENQLAALAGCPEARWSYSTSVTVDVEGTAMDTLPATVTGSVLGEVMCRNCISGSASSVLAELALVREVGGFDEALGYAEDWALWARLAAEAHVAASAEVGVYLRVRGGSYGSDIDKMRRDSLRFLDEAFRGFATSVTDKRSSATSWVHHLAGLGFREAGKNLLAVHAFICAIRHQPLWLSPYKSLAVTLLRPLGK